MVICNFLYLAGPALPSSNKIGGTFFLMRLCISEGAESLPGCRAPRGQALHVSLSTAQPEPGMWRPGDSGSPTVSPISVLRKTRKFIISLAGFSGKTQINFPSLPLSQASQSLNARES